MNSNTHTFWEHNYNTLLLAYRKNLRVRFVSLEADGSLLVVSGLVTGLTPTATVIDDDFLPGITHTVFIEDIVGDATLEID